MHFCDHVLMMAIVSGQCGNTLAVDEGNGKHGGENYSMLSEDAPTWFIRNLVYFCLRHFLLNSNANRLPGILTRILRFPNILWHRLRITGKIVFFKLQKPFSRYICSINSCLSKACSKSAYHSLFSPSPSTPAAKAS